MLLQWLVMMTPFNEGRFMRYLFTILLLCSFGCLQAQSFNQKDTLINTRYKESEELKALANFKEKVEPLPAFPAADEQWLPLYVDNLFDKQVWILPQSVYRSDDRTVRYVLNVRSDKGMDNISVEALFCAEFTMLNNKKSSYKIYAYGDPINKRWISMRKVHWQEFDGTASSLDKVRQVLQRAWCVDGVPSDAQGLLQRLHERAMK